MSSKASDYAWPAIFGAWLAALSLWVGVGMFDYERQFVTLRQEMRRCCQTQVSCDCLPTKACACAPAKPCACDQEQLTELGEHVEALEARASDGESKVLKGYTGILARFKELDARIKRVERCVPPSKPPVRRQASYGAHPPTCEGIAALGADGEPEGVTGVLLCSTSTPIWYPGKCLAEWIQDERLAHAKRVQQRIEERRKAMAALRLLFGMQQGQTK